MIIPSIINLELTNRCNLECVFCDHPVLKKTMRKGDMTQEMLNNFLISLKDQKIYELGLVGLGEPTLNKNLSDHLKLIDKHQDNFTRIALNSNAVYLPEKMIEEIMQSSINYVTFSLNATNREGYKELMVFDKFDQAVANIKSFETSRKKSGRDDLAISVQFMSSNLNDETEMNNIFGEFIGENFSVYNRFVFHKPVLDGSNNDKVNINKADSNHQHPCWSMYSRVYIDIDGNVYPCTIGNDSYREAGTLLIGNIENNGVLDIFNGTRIKKARTDAEHGKLPFPECGSCTLWELFPNNFELVDGQWHATGESMMRRPELESATKN